MPKSERSQPTLLQASRPAARPTRQLPRHVAASGFANSVPPPPCSSPSSSSIAATIAQRWASEPESVRQAYHVAEHDVLDELEVEQMLMPKKRARARRARWIARHEPIVFVDTLRELLVPSGDLSVGVGGQSIDLDSEAPVRGSDEEQRALREDGRQVEVPGSNLNDSVEVQSSY
ncbi:hypothetical protein BC835DRAFT_1003372 [Cytidiella melzeri]|nr:hypothetical protein BC835DRAFT_1003372 [Cytidiella melzeri]